MQRAESELVEDLCFIMQADFGTIIADFECHRGHVDTAVGQDIATTRQP